MTINRFYGFITIALLAALLISCAPKTETESVKQAANPALTVEAVTKADALFKQREDLAKLREAIQTLAAVRNPDARNFEVEWKFAKFNYFLGTQVTDAKEKEKAFADGLQAGKIAERLEPDKPDGYFWHGANLGKQAEENPVSIGIKAVDEIKTAMNKVIELDPQYQNASAYDALGQVELSTAGLMNGKPEKAVEYLEQGIKTEDDNSYLHLHLAQAYLAAGKKDEAKKQLEFVLKMKPNPDFMPEYNESVVEAKKMLETKF